MKIEILKKDGEYYIIPQITSYIDNCGDEYNEASVYKLDIITGDIKLDYFIGKCSLDFIDEYDLYKSVGYGEFLKLDSIKLTEKI